jgi:hypothetical protein
MAQAALDHFEWHTQLSEHVASRVAEAVEVETFEASSAQRRVIDTLTEVGGSNRASAGRLEDQIARIGPASASEVGTQLVEYPIRDRDGPSGRDGLPPAFDETALNFVERGSHGESPPEEVDGADAQAEDLALAETEDSEKRRAVASKSSPSHSSQMRCGQADRC